ncbi:hypothetical protein EYF80_057680 [Liparis tanakae]|uniref:Uncharacterized protein n=1 Tax=Liparis tanakae TaxID=230148 RepID=A0A4Z2EV85_9TELE|nr:hypothetical protein EYF80_057680 [Liparis tanakae]
MCRGQPSRAANNGPLIPPRREVRGDNYHNNAVGFFLLKNLNRVSAQRHGDLDSDQIKTTGSRSRGWRYKQNSVTGSRKGVPAEHRRGGGAEAAGPGRGNLELVLLQARPEVGVAFVRRRAPPIRGVPGGVVVGGVAAGAGLKTPVQVLHRQDLELKVARGPRDLRRGGTEGKRESLSVGGFGLLRAAELRVLLLHDFTTSGLLQDLITAKSLVYLHAAAEQQELQEEEHGAPGEGHAGGELLPSGRGAQGWSVRPSAPSGWDMRRKLQQQGARS